MSVPLHLLVLEDNPSDAELIIYELRRAGFDPDWKRVETESDFLAALDPALDLILADYRLPQFDGLRALNLVRESKLGIPLLIISGTIGEDLAVEAMKKGAADYLLKDRLARLGPAVKQVLERKQAEEKLSASENELQALFAAMTDVVIVLDGEGRYLRIAPTSPINLYRPSEEMLGKTIHEVLPKQPADYMLAKIKEAIQTNQAVPSEYALQIDGKEIWFAGNTTRLSENSVIWVAHDITERKRVEEELQKSEKRLRALLEHSKEEISLVDSEGTLTWESPNIFHPLGYPPDSFVGHNILDLFHPDERAIAIRMLEQIREHPGSTTQEALFRLRHRDGSWRWMEGLLIDLLSEPAVQSLVINYRDITERKQAEEEIHQLNASLEMRVEERTRELRQAQEELVRKEKLAVLGQLAGGVGHELRNPLGVISNSAYYLKMVQPEANEKIKKHLDLIEQEMHNAARIVSDLLDYAREISTDPQPVSIRELLEQTLSRFPVPDSIQVSLKIPANLPQVYADPLHVQQILGNLIKNAWQAISMPPLNTKAGLATLENGGKLIISAHKKRQTVAIAVKDNGIGVNPENMEKLFEPLFSTKITGIGLGLAVSKKLAEANGGRIEVKSEAGKGSTFTLYLPLHHDGKEK